jgi:hypothetical protein
MSDLSDLSDRGALSRIPKPRGLACSLTGVAGEIALSIAKGAFNWPAAVVVLIAALFPSLTDFVLRLVPLLQRNMAEWAYQNQFHKITAKRLEETSGDGLGVLAEDYTSMRVTYLGKKEPDSGLDEGRAEGETRGEQCHDVKGRDTGHEAPPPLKTVDRPA